MDSDDCADEIKDFLNFTSGKEKVKVVRKDVVENECVLRRERDEANKAILTETMKDWSETMDYITTGENKVSNKVNFVNDNTAGNSQWLRLERIKAMGDDFMGAMTRAIYPNILDPQLQEEDNYEQELSKLQEERSSRYQREQKMAKNRTNNKIKAKNYHKHMRKRDIKQYMNNPDENIETDAFKDKLDSLRAEERISLKHKSGGKFAKLKKLRAKFDDDAREALDKMRVKGQELCQKVNDSDNDESDNNEIDNNESDNDESDKDSNIEEMAPEDAHMDVAVNHTLRTLIKEGGTNKARLNVVNVISSNEPMLFDYDEHVANDSNGVQLCANKKLFKEAIYQIYQEDEDLAEEFEREKALLVEKEAPKDVSTFVPGWGCWTGPGLEDKDEKRKARGIIKAPTDNRKDKKKRRVFIKEGISDSLKKHLVKTIPYPYNTIEQYEMSRKQLVSSAFNHEVVFRNLTKPKFITKPGKPIQPVRKTFKNNLNKTFKKAFKNKGQ